ncbi:MAG: FkbM family methyltransferase [bacterium]
MTPRMISYAQNAEDVVLARAFGDRADGFYVDVGANEPTHDSVTRHFYDRGWTGINIEPQAGCFEALQRQRPRDTNLNVGVGSAPGRLTLYVVPAAQAMSTFSAEQAERLHAMGYKTTTRVVEVRTLSEVFAEHVGDRTVDFLKVDVEGLEEDVLGGFDWARWRPRAVVVESFPDVSSWEEKLRAAGYERTLWDGINLFFVRSEDREELGRSLVQPATIVLDRYDPWLYVEQLAAARRQVEPLLAENLADTLRQRCGAEDTARVEPAAAALASVLLERPDVQEAFGVPPVTDVTRLLAWAGRTDIGPGEAHVERLASYRDLYRRLAHAPVRGTARTAGRLDRLKDALPAPARRRLGALRRRLHDA